MKPEKLRRPGSAQIDQALSHWDTLEEPPTAKSSPSRQGEAGSMQAVLDWLYRFVRHNVKRGRAFQLTEVLLYQQADCLGYAKLMKCLGQRSGLDIGIVEVVTDNAGRHVPHYVNLVSSSYRQSQFVDLWYGSLDIHHQRLGAQVREGKRWHIRDLDWGELEKAQHIRGLPARAVDGIDCYVLGNRHMEKATLSGSKEQLSMAISFYTRAICLYPGYARAYFNRAIAYEMNGQHERAHLDYTEALRDEASQIRVLAREHQDVTQLIELDREHIGAKEQEVYLLHRGFVTGKGVSIADIARQYSVPARQVHSIVSSVEARLEN